MTSSADLTLLAEHRRGHGAMYDALNHGRINAGLLRRALAVLPQPKAADNRLVLVVDVSNWLRPDAPCSPDRLFCHVYGRNGRSSNQFVPGWPYSFVAALETGRTSWCQLLDAVRFGGGQPRLCSSLARSAAARCCSHYWWRAAVCSALATSGYGTGRQRARL